MSERRGDLPPFKRDDGSYTDDTIEKAHMMHNYFTRKFENENYSNDIKNYHRSIENIIDHVDLDTNFDLLKTLRF